MKFNQTRLQKISFGDAPSDNYYCLIDKRISPDGMDVTKLKLSDPRNIDQEFKNSGCLLMFTGDEIESLIDRGEIERDHLHSSLYKMAVNGGMI